MSRSVWDPASSFLEHFPHCKRSRIGNFREQPGHRVMAAMKYLKNWAPFYTCWLAKTPDNEAAHTSSQGYKNSSARWISQRVVSPNLSHHKSAVWVWQKKVKEHSTEQKGLTRVIFHWTWGLLQVVWIPRVLFCNEAQMILKLDIRDSNRQI
jgi:hypothetical protein